MLASQITKELANFEKFQDEESALEMVQLLEDAGVYCKLQVPKTYFDAILGTSNVDFWYVLQIEPAMFGAANQAIAQFIRKSGIPADYYILQLPSETLQQMVLAPDQSTRMDYQTVLLELENRGVASESSKVEMMDTAQTANTIEENKISWLAMLVLLLLALLGSVFVLPAGGTLVVGLFLARFKVYNYYGQQQFSFDKNTRTFGWWLSAISLAVLIYILSNLLFLD